MDDARNVTRLRRSRHFLRKLLQLAERILNVSMMTAIMRLNAPVVLCNPLRKTRACISDKSEYERVLSDTYLLATQKFHDN